MSQVDDWMSRAERVCRMIGYAGLIGCRTVKVSWAGIWVVG